jgi:hypothetical protein
MYFFGAGRTSEAGFKLLKKFCFATTRLDLIREGFVEALNDRHHEDDCDDAHTDAKDRQRRAQLISAQRIERHERGFLDVV